VGSIRKRVFKRQRQLLLSLFALVSVLTFAYVTVINPLFSSAASQYMAATFIDDNGNVDFSPGVEGAIANMKYVHSGSNSSDSDVYDVKITLRNLPENQDKKLSILLSAGMSWVDDASNDKNLKTQLDTSKGTNGVEKIALDHEPVKGYAFGSAGTRLYHIASGASALTVSVKVKADKYIDLSAISDAVQASLLINDELVERAKISASIPSAVSGKGTFHASNRTIYVPAGTEFKDNDAGYRGTYLYYVGGHFGATRLVEKAEFNINISNPDAEFYVSSTSGITLDDSDKANGNYVLTYTPSSAQSASYNLPYYIKLPDNLNTGDQVIVSLTGKTSFWQLDGSVREAPFSNTSKITFVILPQSNTGVSVGYNSLNPSSTATAKDVTYSSPIREGDDMTGLLGHTFINNRSAVDSEPKMARLNFDTTAIGVMQVRLSCAPNGKIETIHVESKSGVSKDVAINLACNAYGGTNTISYKQLGLERDDYIKKLEYEIGVIPAATQLHWATTNDSLQAIVMMGRRLDSTQNAVSTIEVYGKDNPENTTGIAKITTTSGRSPGVDVASPATTVVNAGQPLKFNIQIADYGGTMNSYNYGLPAPIIYIRSEVKDAAGNFLPISNIKVTNGDSRGNQDITEKFGQIVCEDKTDARVCKLDGSVITDGSASITSSAVDLNGNLSSNNLRVSFTIETDLLTPDQSYDTKGLILVEAPDGGSITSRSNRGDIYNVTGNPNTIYAATTNYYQIRGWASIGVGNSGKHTSSDEWLTWSEGANPITIGAAEGSLADMKVTMINNSGVDVPGPTTIYLPIPKKDQNWTSLSYEGAAFAFSTALTGPIPNSDPTHFLIAYGKDVTPTDNGSSLDLQSAKFTTDTSAWSDSDWEEVNCIKITATNIPANQPGDADNYDFIYDLKVIDAASVEDGAVNTWRPIYYQQSTNSAGDLFAGWYKGSYVSVKLADGKVSGRLYIDNNEDGHRDEDDEYLQESGWEIDLYDAVSNRLVRSTTTDNNGRYSLIELSVNPNGYYAIVKNKHPIDGDPSEKRYLFALKGELSEPGSYNADNQAEGSKTSSPAHLTGYIGNISPSKNNREATYNIGLIDYIASESYTGALEFDDQSNEFGTRPQTIQLTANASDGTSKTVDITVGQGQTYAIELPRYNAQGVRVKYALVAPDINGYDLDFNTRGDGYVNDIVYSLKKFTVTTNHINDTSEKRIGDTTVQEYYYGQDYETQPVDMPDRVELLSIDGTESGTVSDDVAVNYHYRLIRGVVVTHHYIEGTTDRLADDEIDDYDAGDEYDTNPLGNLTDYELVITSAPDNSAGIVDAPEIEVVYYYRKKSNPRTGDRIAAYLLVVMCSVSTVATLVKTKSRR